MDMTLLAASRRTLALGKLCLRLTRPEAFAGGPRGAADRCRYALRRWLNGPKRAADSCGKQWKSRRRRGGNGWAVRRMLPRARRGGLGGRQVRAFLTGVP